MQIVSVNLVANIIGRGGSILLSFAILPLFVNLLSAEAYGLIGLYTSVLTVFAVLDVGLSALLAREAALRMPTKDYPSPELGEIFRTLELVTFAIVAVVSLGALFILPSFASSMIHPSVLSNKEVTLSLQLIAITGALRLPLALSLALLTGLQRQIATNAIIFGCNCLRAGLGLLAIIFFDAGLIGFFVAQILGTIVELILAQWNAWRSPIGSYLRMPSPIGNLSCRWSFSGGVAYIALTATTMSHIDRIIISSRVSLEQFGVYSIAMTVAMGLLSTVYPVTIALSPSLTNLNERGETQRTLTLYRTFTNLILVVIVPVAITMIAWPNLLLELYLGDSDIAIQTAKYLPIVILGTLFNALVPIAHTAQIAFGQTKFICISNTIYILIYFPTLFIVLERFGLLYLLYFWASFNGIYALAMLMQVGCISFAGSLGTVVFRDNLFPICVGALCALVANWYSTMVGLSGVAAVMVTYISVLTAVILCSRNLTKKIITRIARGRW